VQDDEWVTKLWRKVLEQVFFDLNDYIRNRKLYIKIEEDNESNPDYEEREVIGTPDFILGGGADIYFICEALDVSLCSVQAVAHYGLANNVLIPIRAPASDVSSWCRKCLFMMEEFNAGGARKEAVKGFFDTHIKLKKVSSADIRERQRKQKREKRKNGSVVAFKRKED
jgi:hypothetical protein